MPLRRFRHEPIDIGSYEDAYADLATMREAHESCTESPLDCRAGILWATNTTLAQYDLDAATTRSLLLHHAAEVNDMLARRSSGRVGGLFVAGTHLRAAIGQRST